MEHHRASSRAPTPIVNERTFYVFQRCIQDSGFLERTKCVIHDPVLKQKVDDDHVQFAAKVVYTFSAIVKQVHEAKVYVLNHIPYHALPLFDCLFHEPTWHCTSNQPASFMSLSSKPTYISALTDKVIMGGTPKWLIFGPDAVFCIEEECECVLKAMHRFAHLKVDTWQEFEEIRMYCYSLR